MLGIVADPTGPDFEGTWNILTLGVATYFIYDQNRSILGTVVHCAPNDTTIKREKISIFGCIHSHMVWRLLVK
jgi:hypothetical protein